MLGKRKLRISDTDFIYDETIFSLACNTIEHILSLCHPVKGQLIEDAKTTPRLIESHFHVTIIGSYATHKFCYIMLAFRSVKVQSIKLGR